MEPDILSPGILLHLIRLVEFHPMWNETAGLITVSAQEVLLYDILLQRVCMRLLVLLGLLHLFVIQGNPEPIDVRRIFFLLRNEFPVCFRGSLLDFRVCEYIATNHLALGMREEPGRRPFCDKFLLGLHLLLSSA